MKKFRRSIAYLLSFIMLIVIGFTGNKIEKVHAATYGYVYVQYINDANGSFIQPTYTWNRDLTGYPNQSVDISMSGELHPDIGGYALQNYEVSNGIAYNQWGSPTAGSNDFLNDKPTLTVTADKTMSNPITVKFHYIATASSVPVKMGYILTYSDGTTTDNTGVFSANISTSTLPATFKYGMTDLSTHPEYTYVSSSIKYVVNGTQTDGAGIGTGTTDNKGNINISVTNKTGLSEIDVVYNYKVNALADGDVDVSVVDNYLDMTTGSPVVWTDTNTGLDYFARKDMKIKSVGGILTIPTMPDNMSPTWTDKNTGKSQTLTLAKTVMATDSGNPTTALTATLRPVINDSDPNPTTGTPTKFVTMHTSTFTYVHRYWYINMKKAGTITVNYVNEAGSAISPPDILTNRPMGANTVSAKVISGFTVIPPSSKTVTLTDAAPDTTVTFTYKANATPPPVGYQIKYTPSSTAPVGQWSNAGKISDGVGAFNVQMTALLWAPTYKNYDSYQPYKSWYGDVIGTGGTPPDTYDIYGPPYWHFSDYNFGVVWNWQTLIANNSGQVSVPNGHDVTAQVVQEGIIKIDGDRIYTKGAEDWHGVTVQTGPAVIVEPNIYNNDSEAYWLDWSKPKFTATGTINKWTTYPVSSTATVTDNLSGFHNSTFGWRNTSHYGGSDIVALPEGALTFTKTGVFTQGIYQWELNGGDVAGNTSNDTYGSYYVDQVKPTATFSVSNGIFDERNGAVRGTSILGKYFDYTGNITLHDDLSGVRFAEYKWVYATNTAGGTWRTLVNGPVTYSDRNSEYKTYTVEKPVGDNMVLMVHETDCAGNDVTTTFGPFSDEQKVYNFRVTDVKDPNFKNVFYNADGTSKNVSFYANKLPLDKANGGTTDTVGRGYAIYFDIMSEFLYRDNDRIDITPSFALINSDGTRTALDAYYISGSHMYKIGDATDPNKVMLSPKSNVSLGGFGGITLYSACRYSYDREWSAWKNTVQYSDGKIQNYKGRYFVPSNTVFVKQGVTASSDNWLTTGKVMMNFNIVSRNSYTETNGIQQIFNNTPA